MLTISSTDLLLPCKQTAGSPARACDVLLLGQHQSLKGCNEHRHQGLGLVVVLSSGGGFLGDCDDCEVFEAGGDFTQRQRDLLKVCVKTGGPSGPNADTHALQTISTSGES